MKEAFSSFFKQEPQHPPKSPRDNGEELPSLPNLFPTPLRALSPSPSPLSPSPATLSLDDPDLRASNHLLCPSKASKSRRIAKNPHPYPLRSELPGEAPRREQDGFKVPLSVIEENKRILQEKGYYIKKEGALEKVDLQFHVMDMRESVLVFGGWTWNQFKERWHKFKSNTKIPKHYNTEIRVMEGNCIDVAIHMFNQTGTVPLLHNMAQRSIVSVCGAWDKPKNGSQEETIERRSAVYRLGLDPSFNSHFEKLLTELNHGTRPNHHIPEFGSVYLGSVPLIRDASWKLQEVPFFLDIVACGGIDLKLTQVFKDGERAKYYEGSYNPLVKSILRQDLFEKHTKAKIKSILMCALETGHKDLVLGAMGCGSFQNPPVIIASCFKSVLNSPVFANAFRNVVFATLGGTYATFSVFFKPLHDYTELKSSDEDMNPENLVESPEPITLDFHMTPTISHRSVFQSSIPFKNEHLSIRTSTSGISKENQIFVEKKGYGGNLNGKNFWVPLDGAIAKMQNSISLYGGGSLEEFSQFWLQNQSFMLTTTKKIHTTIIRVTENNSFDAATKLFAKTGIYPLVSCTWNDHFNAKQYYIDKRTPFLKLGVNPELNPTLKSVLKNISLPDYGAVILNGVPVIRDHNQELLHNSLYFDIICCKEVIPSTEFNMQPESIEQIKMKIRNKMEAILMSALQRGYSDLVLSNIGFKSEIANIEVQCYRDALLEGKFKNLFRNIIFSVPGRVNIFEFSQAFPSLKSYSEFNSSDLVDQVPLDGPDMKIPVPDVGFNWTWQYQVPEFGWLSYNLLVSEALESAFLQKKGSISLQSKTQEPSLFTFTHESFQGTQKASKNEYKIRRVPPELPSIHENTLSPSAQPATPITIHNRMDSNRNRVRATLSRSTPLEITTPFNDHKFRSVTEGFNPWPEKISDPILPLAYKKFSYIYYWIDSNSRPNLFPPQTTADIERAKQQNMNAIKINIAGKDHLINIAEMKQMCLSDATFSWLGLSSLHEQWYFLDEDGTYQPYDDTLNTLICTKVAEKRASHLGKLQPSSNIIRTMVGKHTYEIDVIGKVQTNITTKKTRKLVTETDLDKIRNWELSIPLPKKATSYISLETNSPEYQRVAELFYVSVPKLGKNLVSFFTQEKFRPINSILRIEKIAHPEHRTKFVQTLEDIKKKHAHSPPTNYVKTLFYSNPLIDPSLVVAENNFSREFPDTPNEKPFGPHFPHYTELALPHLKNCWRTPADTRKMILAEVIVGEGYHYNPLADKQIKFPYREERFDSVMGTSNGFWYYVVPDDSRVYPTFIIEFQPETLF